tara:strand:+ start:25341 stop:25922 length:582 start_codon:yes stop_codon:yes gene_type:complete
MKNENDKKKEMISEHEQTKNMLDILRGSNKAKMNATFLNEDTSIFDKGTETEDTEDSEMEADQSIDADEITDVGEGEDAVKVSGADLSDEQDKINDIEATATITSLTVYPESKNAVMTGNISGMNDAQFQFVLTDHDGLYLTANSMQIGKDDVVVLSKLQGYYTNWSKEWSTKIRKEYTSGNIKTTSTFDDIQ